MQKFTEEDLILYLYKDCSARLSAAIEEALQMDIELKDRLLIVKRTIRQLNKLQLLSPSKDSIKAILKHAKQK